MTPETPRLGVYVHWPFCARICPYCDFNVYRNRGVEVERWHSALIRDLEYWAARAPGRKLTSLYFGGGTPSLAPLPVIESVIEACERLWGFDASPEITLEANPTDAERDRFADFARAGVNRLSLGVQSFDDEALKFLGRDHDGVSARQSVELALSVFPRMTFDLIYALPGETAEAWRKSLQEALALGAPHLSLYQLTIEEGTAFDKAVTRGRWAPPEDDVAAALFDIAQEETAKAGLPAYEVSNHAGAGNESKHNMLYWTGGDYVGVGPGAHGRLTIGDERLATETHLRPEEYLAAVESEGYGASLTAPLNAEARLVERLSMGLRLMDGMTLSAREVGTLGARAARFQQLSEEGFLSIEGARLRATADGRRVLNAMLARLLT